MEATIPEVKVERQDRIIERHLLGLGVLVVTLTTGYMLTGLSGVRQDPPAPRPAVARVEGTEGDVTPSEDDIDTQAGMDAFIKKVSAKYNVPPDVVAAVIEAESRVDRFQIYQMLLLPLERVKQSPKYHPEGDTLYHSLQVFDLARDELPYDEEFLLAALLHDVGKGLDPANHG